MDVDDVLAEDAEVKWLFAYQDLSSCTSLSLSLWDGVFTSFQDFPKVEAANDEEVVKDSESPEKS